MAILGPCLCNITDALTVKRHYCERVVSCFHSFGEKERERDRVTAAAALS